jgi:hypothetical protein
MGLQLRPAMAAASDSSASNNTGSTTEERWVKLAQALWLNTTCPPDVKPETIKARVWDALEIESFDPRSISLLETLQVLERYIHEDNRPLGL